MNARPRQFQTTPEVLLMDRFPPDIPWSIAKGERGGLLAKARGSEHRFESWAFREAVCWVAVQLGVPVT